MSSLLRQVKHFILDMAEKRAHRFMRVGSDFYLKFEANLKEFIRQSVQRLPSKAKTFN